MKKLIAILTAVVIAAMAVIPAFAETTITTLPGQDTGEVKVNVYDEHDQELTTVYYVVVSWDDLTFTFNFDGDNTEVVWDPTTHKYMNGSSEATGTWAAATKNVTVTNHSNAAVAYAAKFTNDAVVSEAKNGVTATLEDQGTGTLITAEGTAVSAAPAAQYSVTVSGTPTTKEAFTVDTITVAITAAP